MSGPNADVHGLRALLDEVDVALDRCEARGTPVHPADRAAVVAARAYLAAPSDDDARAARARLDRALDACGEVPPYGMDVAEADGEVIFHEAHGAAGLAAVEAGNAVFVAARLGPDEVSYHRRLARKRLARAYELLEKDGAT